MVNAGNFSNDVMTKKANLIFVFAHSGLLIGAVCAAGLQSGDAEFVHIIHTDRGVYGTSLS